MRGHIRIGGAGFTPSPSPPSSPRPRHFSRLKPPDDSKGGGGGGAFSPYARGGGGGAMKLCQLVERLLFFLISAMFRRKGILLFAPMLYISCMLLYMGSLNIDSGGRGGVTVDSGVEGGFVLDEPRLPGSLYRSPEVFEMLWPFLSAESNRSSNMLATVWQPKFHQHWKPCINKSKINTGLPESNGYFIIEANGGLNQQRLSICDAVAVAGLLNATLVIPFFHLNSVWRDSSKFGDIFDEDFFIHALSKKVNVVRQLPEDILERFDHNISNIINLRLKGWSSPKYYLNKVLPKLSELSAVRVAPFSNRLAQEVPPSIQELRCFANFEALRFSEPIRAVAELMVQRMIRNSFRSGGKYVSVHLRFEKDMVAFSCCLYDGGAKEKQEMDAAREKGWRGKFRKRGRITRPVQLGRTKSVL